MKTIAGYQVHRPAGDGSHRQRHIRYGWEQPAFVVETPKTLKIRSGCDGGGKGALIQENKSATLGCNNDQTVFVPKVYGICSKQSHAMLSDNPHSGFYEADTSRCLDRSGGNPTCNQGGMAVVAVQGSMIGRQIRTVRRAAA